METGPDDPASTRNDDASNHSRSTHRAGSRRGRLPRWSETVERRLRRVCTLLLTGLIVGDHLLTATTSTFSGVAHGPRHPRTQSVVTAATAGVIAFVAMLAMAVAIDGVGLVRRLRSGIEAPSLTGGAFVGVVGLLGILPLATIGLAMIILAAPLAVVTRPHKKPRPLPSEQVVSILAVGHRSTTTVEIVLELLRPQSVVELG